MPDSDQTSERQDRQRATMRDRTSTNLNTSGKEGVPVCSPKQATKVTKYQSDNRSTNVK